MPVPLVPNGLADILLDVYVIILGSSRPSSAIHLHTANTYQQSVAN